MSRSSVRLSRLIGLAATAAAAGCGGVTAASPDGGGGDAAVEMHVVTTEEGCNQVAKALCDALNACAPVFVEEQYGDEATCISRTALVCMTDQGLPAITRTPDDLVACAQVAPGTSCADALAGRFPAACQIKPGTTANGLACGSNLQCQSGYCNKTDACGVCGPRQAAAGGCTSNDGCMQGLVCANKTCVAPAELGKPCNLPNQPCRSDLYCTSSSGSGTCAARIESGGPCADNPGDACDVFKGNICNTQDHTCLTINIAKGGEKCGILSKTACVGGIAPCSNLLSGVCANPAQDGETCGDANNAVCVPPATCVNKVCRLPSAPNCM
jgi:hypothetical protein